uniref:Uncharacterized protein n=1 Tax=Anguilla anguilla TaxID=7936 RepID=A0A0E9XBW7_ANGAN
MMLRLPYEKSLNQCTQRQMHNGPSYEPKLCSDNLNTSLQQIHLLSMFFRRNIW